MGNVEFLVYHFLPWYIDYGMADILDRKIENQPKNPNRIKKKLTNPNRLKPITDLNHFQYNYDFMFQNFQFVETEPNYRHFKKN